MGVACRDGQMNCEIGFGKEQPAKQIRLSHVVATEEEVTNERTTQRNATVRLKPNGVDVSFASRTAITYAAL